jgi:hypothetical protein
LESTQRLLKPALLVGVDAVQALGGLAAPVFGEKLGEGCGIQTATSDTPRRFPSHSAESKRSSGIDTATFIP